MKTHCWSSVVGSFAPLLISAILASSAQADIFQWEYVNPADPSQGKQQSMTLCIEGAGAYVSPGADLAKRNLTMAYLIGADLTGAYALAINLTNWELSRARLQRIEVESPRRRDPNPAEAPRR